MSDTYDVAIVGGGPAGLTGALWLARYLHKVVLIDSGDPRNWETRGINGFLGESGIKPSQLRGYGRAECEKYGVELVDDTVDEATNRNGDLFSLQLKSGRCIEARRVLLAIGIKDVWPDIDGLDRCYGETVHVCPDCDGYESRDKQVVIVGKSRKAVGMALALTTWTDKIVICTNGESADISAAHCDQLAKLNIPVIEAKIRRLASNGTEIRAVELEDDMQLDCESLFFAIGQYPADDLGAQLKCDRDEFGLIVVDEHYHTSVKNVFAAGDIVPGPQLAIAAASDGAIAALAIHHSLIPEQRLLK
ncbi:MAG: NAD(P)/FAD-dependent oxidoreductase [Gemmatimonadota bacterium]|nr:NAD(P)/FAD-dependent oxidoreductase [Gemmatimonadota bacterium]